MGAFSTLRPFGLLYSYPQQVPPFISRGATHHTDARDLYQRRRELLPMNFASKSVIHENSLGSFTCRKAGTGDILFYFPSEGRHTEDFPDARKIQRLRPGLNPRTRVPVASVLTTRPPKPSFVRVGRILLWKRGSMPTSSTFLSCMQWHIKCKCNRFFLWLLWRMEWVQVCYSSSWIFQYEGQEVHLRVSNKI